MAWRQRYVADLTRYRQAMLGVAKKQRETRTIPDDVKEGRDAVIAKMTDVNRAMATRDDDQIAKALEAFEEALGVLEERVK